MLISEDGRATLSEFGTSMKMTNLATVAAQRIGECVRWTAPELLQASEQPMMYPLYTKASDVWAFGMVVYVRRIAHGC